MRTKEVPIVTFLKELMRRRKRLPSQLASDLGINHATVLRWLSAKDIPSPRSCQRLARYSGEKVLTVLAIAGHMPQISNPGTTDWPEFREYALQKYPDELDEDLVTMIEYLIKRRRQKCHQRPRSGKKSSGPI